MVNQHKHLLKPGERLRVGERSSGIQCIGGGYYVFDFVSNRIILDRESYDFGRPKWHLLDVLKVLALQASFGRAPSTYCGMRIVYRL